MIKTFEKHKYDKTFEKHKYDETFEKHKYDQYKYIIFVELLLW